MPIFQPIVVLVFIGVGLYLINAYIPMDEKIKKILNIAVVVVTCLWLFQVFFGPLPNANVKVGR